MYEVFFDVETKNLFRDVASSDPQALGVSIVSVYHRHVENDKELDGNMVSFWESEFPNMWDIFLKSDRIIGFNSLKFDVPALAPYAPSQFAKLKHFDIMDKVKQKIGFRLGLNALAKTTLGREKTDEGVNAVKYWNSGDPESLSKLKFYCEADVLLTKELYDFGRKQHHLKYIDKWNSEKIIDIDFSYPPLQQASKNQISLF